MHHNHFAIIQPSIDWTKNLVCVWILSGLYSFILCIVLQNAFVQNFGIGKLYTRSNDGMNNVSVLKSSSGSACHLLISLAMFRHENCDSLLSPSLIVCAIFSSPQVWI